MNNGWFNRFVLNDILITLQMKRGFEEMLKYVVIGINLLLTFFFAGGYYAIVGILLVIFSTIVAAFLTTSEVAYFIIRS